MSVIISSVYLRKSLEGILKITPIGKNKNLPKLEFIRLEVNERDVITLISTNLTITAHLEVYCKTNGVIGPKIIPWRPFLNLLKVLDDQPIALTFNEKRVNIIHAFGVSSLWLGDIDDFIVDMDRMITNPGYDRHKLPIELINDSVLLKGFVGHDDLRPALNHVYFEGDKNKIGSKVVATDAHRLIAKRYDSDSNLNGVVIPINFLVGLRKALIPLSLISDVDIFIISGTGGTFMYVNNDRLFIRVRLTDDKYPNFKPLFTDGLYSIRVNKDELMMAIKIASVTAEPSTRKIKLSLKGDDLEVYSSGFDKKEMSSAQISVNKNGPDIHFGMNYIFLMDCINAIHSQDVIIYYSSPRSAFFITTQEQKVVTMVMPIMIENDDDYMPFTQVNDIDKQDPLKSWRGTP